jgi:hypothetical protein
MNNLLPYCGLIDARISVSEKYLPVQKMSNYSIKISSKCNVEKEILLF